MYANSLISLINKVRPKIEVQVYNNIKKKFEKQIKDNYLVSSGEEIFIISCSKYQGKNGFFSICLNKRNEVFFLDDTEIDFGVEDKEAISNLFVIKYANKTPIFEDKEEKSLLDD